MGYIHTHPGFGKAPSSIDIHQFKDLQLLEPRAICFILSYLDETFEGEEKFLKKGLLTSYRLSPVGMQHVQKCTLKGFHESCAGPHPADWFDPSVAISWRSRLPLDYRRGSIAACGLNGYKDTSPSPAAAPATAAATSAPSDPAAQDATPQLLGNSLIYL